MNFFAAYALTFLFFLCTVCIFVIINFGLNEIGTFLYYMSIVGSMYVLFGCLIIESVLRGNFFRKELLVLFLGFLYGIVLVIITNNSTEISMYVYVIAGSTSSVLCLIYYFLRTKASKKLRQKG